MTGATNIRLPEEVLKALKYKASEERKSVNQLIREAIEDSLAISSEPERKGKDSFDTIVGISYRNLNGINGSEV